MNTPTFVHLDNGEVTLAIQKHPEGVVAECFVTVRGDSINRYRFRTGPQEDARGAVVELCRFIEGVSRVSCEFFSAILSEVSG